MTMNTLSPDDPRLTAYALGEMNAAERAEFEALLQAQPAARQWIDEVHATSSLLTGALESEPVAADASVEAAAIVPGRDWGKLDGGRAKESGKLVRFPHFYYVTSGLAAACFALFFVYWQNNRTVFQKRQYTEVDLAQFNQAKAESVAVAEARVQEREESGASEPMSAKAAVESERARSTGLQGMDLASTGAPEPLKDGAAGSGDIGAELKAAVGAAASAPKPVTAKVAITAALPRSDSRAPSAPPPAPAPAFAAEAHDTEAYGFRRDNAFQRVADHPLSTFSIDVDTASYANVRRYLLGNRRPPIDAVRIEEMLNYFPYQYQGPSGDVPFAATMEVASAPWAPEHRLVRIGLKGREVTDAARPAANLVFLIDVSGSMQAANKLPLVKQSLRLLVERLRNDDRVAIAVYAGNSGLALPSTPASRKDEILAAIERLEAGGSTNGGMGIHLAYDLAKANFIGNGVNRVILATDGDFNVGTTSEGELTRLIEEKAASGVFLSVLGFGMGNLKDSTLEALADKGNGNYAYIDTLGEARKALVEQAGGTLVTIAKDVKIQVEFNPAQVRSYRLIGYENRLLAREDFANDKIDAGEIGAGHTVTALYEVVPAGAAEPGAASATEALRYQPVSAERSASNRDGSSDGRKARTDSSVGAELLAVSVRYKEPAADSSKKLLFPMRDDGRSFEQASPDFKFAAAVAGFGMMLRNSRDRGDITLADVTSWGRAGLGSDPGSYRHEFLTLVERAKPLL